MYPSRADYQGLLEEMTGALKVLNESGDEAIKLQAKLCRKAFDALVHEGFSPEHACLIIAHLGTGLTVKQN